MRITKGGISRNIDEKRLDEYLLKGYKKEADLDKSALKSLTYAQLKKIAKEKGIDLKGISGKEAILEALWDRV